MLAARHDDDDDRQRNREFLNIKQVDQLQRLCPTRSVSIYKRSPISTHFITGPKLSLTSSRNTTCLKGKGHIILAMTSLRDPKVGES